MLLRKLFPDKAQSLTDPLFNFVPVAIAPLVPDAQPGQPKSRGGNAGHGMRIATVHQGPIFHLSATPRLRPKKIERTAFDLVQQIVIRPAIRNTLRFHKTRMLLHRSQPCTRARDNARGHSSQPLPPSQPHVSAHQENPEIFIKRITAALLFSAGGKTKSYPISSSCS